MNGKQRLLHNVLGVGIGHSSTGKAPARHRAKHHFNSAAAGLSLHLPRGLVITFLSWKYPPRCVTTTLAPAYKKM
jgi:hypothetical protein